jgi:hypothetical protein
VESLSLKWIRVLLAGHPGFPTRRGAGLTIVVDRDVKDLGESARILASISVGPYSSTAAPDPRGAIAPGSGKASIADHSWSINASRSPTLLRFSTPGSAFHNASSRFPVSGAACNSSFDTTAISPSFAVAGASQHSVIPSLPMNVNAHEWVLLIAPAELLSRQIQW